MNKLCIIKAKAFTNKIWYTYKDNKLIFSKNQENANKMVIRGKCYYVYDEKGRMILKKEILTDDKNENEPTVFYKKYNYDQKNRLAYIDDCGDVYRYKYNKENNIICKEWGSEFETFEKTFHKYKDGREVLIKSSEGWIERKIYKNNKIISTRRNKDNKIIFREIRKLDKKGNVIEIKDTYRTYQYKYDSLNNIIYCKEYDNKYLYRETWNTYEKYKLVSTKEIEYIRVRKKYKWFYEKFLWR